MTPRTDFRPRLNLRPHRALGRLLDLDAPRLRRTRVEQWLQNAGLLGSAPVAAHRQRRADMLSRSADVSCKGRRWRRF
jgi:hypothetical protein